jgi:hypothetical protein
MIRQQQAGKAGKVAARPPQNKTGKKHGRGPNRINQREITRTIRGIERAGYMPGHVEIDLPSGRVSIGVAKPSAEPAEANGGNEWDATLGRHDQDQA